MAWGECRLSKETQCADPSIIFFFCQLGTRARVRQRSVRLPPRCRSARDSVLQCQACCPNSALRLKYPFSLLMRDCSGSRWMHTLLHCISLALRSSIMIRFPEQACIRPFACSLCMHHATNSICLEQRRQRRGSGKVQPAVPSASSIGI